MAHPVLRSHLINICEHIAIAWGQASQQSKYGNTHAIAGGGHAITVNTLRNAINRFEKVIPVSVMSHACTADFIHAEIHSMPIAHKWINPCAIHARAYAETHMIPHS